MHPNVKCAREYKKDQSHQEIYMGECTFGHRTEYSVVSWVSFWSLISCYLPTSFFIRVTTPNAKYSLLQSRGRNARWVSRTLIINWQEQKRKREAHEVSGKLFCFFFVSQVEFHRRQRPLQLLEKLRVMPVWFRSGGWNFPPWRLVWWNRPSHCSQYYEKNIKATIFITCPGARALKCTFFSPCPP